MNNLLLNWIKLEMAQTMVYRCCFYLICSLFYVDAAAPATVTTIPTPQGYTRISYPQGSYSNWITHLPVRSDKMVATFSGAKISSDYYNVFAVIDMPLLFKQDLEQCADWCFRLWAEYFKDNNRLSELYLFDYNGNRKYLKKSNRSFAQHLKWTMAHANSHSIKKGTKEISTSDLQPGDMIVQNEGGGIGHVSVIMSVSQSRTGEKLFLIGFSFMPA